MVFSFSDVAAVISRPSACVEMVVVRGTEHTHAAATARLSREASLATTSPKNSSSKAVVAAVEPWQIDTKTTPKKRRTGVGTRG